MNRPTLLPTSQVALEAEVIPFKVAPSHTDKEQVLALLDKFRQQVVDNSLDPRALIMLVVERVGPDREKTYALSTPMARMEVIGNLFALATELTVEPT